MSKVQLAVHYSNSLDHHHAAGEYVMVDALREDLHELWATFTEAEWDEYHEAYPELLDTFSAR